MHVLLLLPVLALACASLAQGNVPPFQVSQTNPHVSLAVPTIPGSQVQQICLVHVASDPPHIYQCGLTVVGLVGFGAVGGYDLLMGTYDITTDTFTPTSDAAALNTSGLEFGLQIHHSGLMAVFDRLPGPPHFATRTAVNQPWVYVGPITLPSQSYYDPALADYNGQTWLLHVHGTGIGMTPINTQTGQPTGPTVTIVNAAAAGSTANSPTPVLDLNNQLIGLSHHDVLGSDNDHYMSLDLDPNTPSVLMNDTTTWTNNGDFIGGRFFEAEQNTAGYNIFSIDTFWCTGGRGQIGGSMSVQFYSPPTAGNELYLSALLVGAGFLPTPVAVPGLAGVLGINPIGATWFGLFQHNNLNGTGSTTFSIPNIAALHNLKLSAQQATLEALSSTIRLANTAALIVE